MKKTTSLLLALVLCTAFLPILTACGNQPKAVPDDFAIRAVEECRYAHPQSATYVIHKEYDSESYLDYVTIVSKSEGKYGYFISTCEAIFQYNRASDLWFLLDAKKWTEPSYTFNNRLVGTHNITPRDEYEKISGYIKILSVTEKEIQLYYDISADVDIFFSLFEDLHIEKSGKETLVNGEFCEYYYDTACIDVDIKLPEGWCDSSDESDYILLKIRININTGIESIYINSIVRPKNSN